jgi:osmoprotectant transport system substrate-binding protein
VLRKDLAEEYPEIEEIIGPVAEKLTDEVLIKLNAKIDVDGMEPTDVADEWLRDEGFIS